MSREETLETDAHGHVSAAETGCKQAANRQLSEHRDELLDSAVRRLDK